MKLASFHNYGIWNVKGVHKTLENLYTNGMKYQLLSQVLLKICKARATLSISRMFHIGKEFRRHSLFVAIKFHNVWDLERCVCHDILLFSTCQRNSVISSSLIETWILGNNTSSNHHETLNRHSITLQKTCNLSNIKSTLPISCHNA